jgi:hypothetical protein
MDAVSTTRSTCEAKAASSARVVPSTAGRMSSMRSRGITSVIGEATWCR